MLLLTICSMLLLGPPNQADTLTVDTSVKSVKVYLSGAEVTRQASFTLKPGINYIGFADLPASLRSETIQFVTETEITLKSLTVKQDPEAGNEYADELDEIKAKKEALQAKIDENNTTLTVLNRKLNLLLANQDLSGEGTAVTVSTLKNAMAYFSEKFREIEQQKVATKNKKQQLQKMLKKLNKKIQQVKRLRKKTGGVAEAVIFSPSQKQIDLQLSYVVRDAYWYPSYDIRVEDIAQPLTLIYEANIHQATGVDWEEVDLTISSAEPRSGSTIPDIDPVYLSFYTPRTINLDADFELKEASEVTLVKQKRMVPPSPRIEIKTALTSFNIEIEAPYSIQSGEMGKTVVLKNYTLPATYQYVTVPKIREQAYLSAKITEWADLYLLPGEANLYLGNSFVGSTELDINTTQDTLRFSLGNDERIIVNREKIEEFTEKNFFGNKVTETKGWEIALKNTKDKPVEIKVIDQIPLSTNEDIDVSLQESSGASYDSSTGKLTWVLKLKPEATKTVSFVYEIEYPEGKTLERNS